MALGAVDVLTESLAAPAGATWVGMNHGQRRSWFILHTLDLANVGFTVRADQLDPNGVAPPGRG